MLTTIIRPSNTPSLQCGVVGQDSVSVEPDDYDDYTFTPDGDVIWDDVHNPEDNVEGDPYEGEQTEDPFEYADDEAEEAEEDVDEIDEG